LCEDSIREGTPKMDKKEKNYKIQSVKLSLGRKKKSSQGLGRGKSTSRGHETHEPHHQWRFGGTVGEKRGRGVGLRLISLGNWEEEGGGKGKRCPNLTCLRGGKGSQKGGKGTWNNDRVKENKKGSKLGRGAKKVARKVLRSKNLLPTKTGQVKRKGRRKREIHGPQKQEKIQKIFDFDGPDRETRNR